MSQKYCMHCGKPNPLDAVFCNKCANSFDGKAQAARPSRQSPVIIEDEEEEDSIPTRLRPTCKRGPLVAPKPVLDPLSQAMGEKPNPESGFTVELPKKSRPDDEEEDNEGGDGVSLDYVPEVTRLEVESIQVDQVRGVTFGQLVEEARLEKERQERQAKS